jgi:phosphatidylethanolamine/phosphatidyl-N-methylethanolamine N-methyltransferase
VASASARDSGVSALGKEDVEAAYARWAPVYDLAFTTVMAAGRRAAVAAAEEAARKAQGPVLDVGVGTGLELPMFSRDVTVVGVDLSVPMLRRAARRVSDERLGHVAGLLAMDATRLAFPDAAFAAVVAPYVMTVVPDPARTLDELWRVTRPGGEIVLVNHVGAESGPIAWAEAALGRFGDRLGWRPEFPWSVIGDWITARSGATLLERRPVPPLGLFTLARIGKAGDG